MNLYTQIYMHIYIINISPILLAALGSAQKGAQKGAQLVRGQIPVDNELSPGLNDGNTLYSLIYIYIY